MNRYFSKFQITIFLLIIISFFLFFIFFSLSKFNDIFRSVYLQENQSIEDYNYYTMSLISNLEKNYKNIFVKKQSDLPEIRIYLKENKLDQLTDNLPKSKNKWISSFLLNQEKNKLLKIQMKIRGDNPNNWLHSKKSYRIKFQKKDLLNLNRTLDYIIPRDSSLVNTYLGYYIADQMKIITPKVRFVNVFINDELKGLYLEVERTNENFLRKRNLMPVNIYSGSPSRTNKPLSIQNDLFINSKLWQKQSFFNRLEENNTEEIDNFFKILISSINSKTNFNKLKEIANLNDWAKYSAYETIMQSWHSYENNNMKIISDNWKGEIIPIAYDQIFNDTKSEIIVNEKVKYDNAPHLLTDTLLKSSEFNLKKYTIIKNLIEDEIFTKIKNEIDHTYNKIKLSWYADPNHFQFIVTNKLNSKLFFNKYMDKEIIKLKQRVDFIENSLKKIIYEKNISKWFFEKDGINLIVSSFNPITSINICYESKIQDNRFYFQNIKNAKNFNYNLFQNLHCYKKNVSLFSNRVRVEDVSLPTHFKAFNGFVSLPTSFIIKNSNNIKPKYIFYTTDNLEKYFHSPIVENDSDKFYPPNIHNQPIFDRKDLHKNFQVFEGLVLINKNLIVDNPALIKPGTKFIMKEGKSIIFKNKTLILGKESNKVVFEGQTSNTKWGTISIEGDNSFIINVKLSGGFGTVINNKFYTSMLSIRNSKNISLYNVDLIQNNEIIIPEYYDDLLHVIYSSNVLIKNSNFYNSIGDALDVDVSEVKISNCYFENSGNDSIDFMSSIGTIFNTNIFKSGDKGISVGERSKIEIFNSSINNSLIGLESKDSSFIKAYNSILANNNINLHGYNKNWRYGTMGGNFEIVDSKFISDNLKTIFLSKITDASGNRVHKNIEDFSSNKNVFISKDNSNIIIKNSIIENDYYYIGKNLNIQIVK